MRSDLDACRSEDIQANNPNVVKNSNKIVSSWIVKEFAAKPAACVVVKTKQIQLQNEVGSGK